MSPGPSRVAAKSPSQARRAAIARIIRREQVSTQEDLVQRLAAAGFDVNQATVSRDLTHLGAVRVSRADGQSHYGLEASPLGADASQVHALHGLVVDVDANETMGVVHTQPGAASAIARVLDLEMRAQLLGTIAGDDCVFVCVRRGQRIADIVAKINLLFALEP